MMLTLLLGTDWTCNTKEIYNRIALDVHNEQSGRILMVPELISHESERRLLRAAGDTTSRFAEVLSFTRLASRVAEYTGALPTQCLDGGGRVVAMAAAVRQMHSRLKAYAAVETNPEFLTGMVDAVDEFKRCCIRSDDLKTASEKSEGSLAQKLEELSLILEAYDSVCSLGKKDPRDQMTVLLEQLINSDFCDNHTFYFDGFPDFSRLHMDIVECLIENCPNVTVSLTCDEPSSADPAFEKAGKTAFDLIQFAKNNGIEYEVIHIKPKNTALGFVAKHLFQGKTDGKIVPELTCCQYDSVYEECYAAAYQIRQLVQSGCRYRDISVVCADLSKYKDPLNIALHKSDIPVYLSGTEEILDKTIIHTVLSALDAALGGFEQKDMIRYLKSMLSPVSGHTCDLIENYALLWSVSGKKWTQEWTAHPAGMSEQWHDEHRILLKKLNDARKRIITPLEKLRKNFLKANNLRQQVLAIYDFLMDIKLRQRLQLLAADLEKASDHRNVQILNQLWEILLNALEQLHDVLGDTVWDEESFVRLLKLLLSQYDVGTIPAVLDAVTVGNISSMRCQMPKHLIVLGASEGVFPAYGGSAGVLNDVERSELQKLGLHLNAGAIDGLQTSFSEIYDVFCGAGETVRVSCSSDQPSFVYLRLEKMAGSVNNKNDCYISNKWDANARFIREGVKDLSEQSDTLDVYQCLIHSKDHTLGQVQPHHIEGLYGNKLNLSASQIDNLAECKLRYFLRYGLRLKERKPARIDPAEFGTYVHAVLEECGKRVLNLGGFDRISLDEILEMAEEISDQYFTDNFNDLDSERLSYQFRKNSLEVELVVEEFWKEMQESLFQAAYFELDFGNGKTMEPVAIPGAAIDAQIRGFVDRVDVWKDEGRSYFKVVDYKTGRKDFDYCDVFNGIGLQMLLYLYALEDEGQKLLGEHPVPTGVEYFPARVPFVTADGALSDDEGVKAREKNFRRKGLLLDDERVLLAMDQSENIARLPVKRNKDGVISGDIANSKQFKMLKNYVFHILRKLVSQIASGNIDPNPYTRGSSHNACSFCPYGAICHEETVENRRNYQAMNAERFWEEIEKELNRHG